MRPLRFGPPGRQLFGLAHAPAPGQAAGVTVLLCNPFGQEAVRSHRLLRLLAERLARQGCHVLRFDYFGTGDSDGDDLDLTLPGAVDDVLLASAEALRLSGPARLCWFGLRLGGTLAALASERSPQPLHRLVLWDPVAQGEAYLDELADAHAAEVKLLHGHRPRRGQRAPGRVADQALGFALSNAWRDQVAALRPGSLAAARAGRIVLMASPLAQPVAPLAAALGGQDVSTQTVDAAIVWASDEAMNTAIAPQAALATAATALVEPA